MKKYLAGAFVIGSAYGLAQWAGYGPQMRKAVLEIKKHVQVVIEHIHRTGAAVQEHPDILGAEEKGEGESENGE
ncbi:MAG: hypothetical protein LBS14_02665 [Holosporaceae bacterium]|jgi:hypothetical protein|nr:hypothetical protein [Holosporaceae bacterium]